jgi:hypothetical protein
MNYWIRTFIFLLLVNTSQVLGQENELDGIDVVFYSSSQWLEYPQYCPACKWNQMWPDSMLFNESSHFSGDMPGIGYPFHKSLIKGINDTLTVDVSFLNGDFNKDYDMTSKDVKDWFEPVVYQLFVTDSGGPKFRDASQIGFQLHGWYLRSKPISAPSKIPAGSANFSARFEIWGLPEGRYQVCLIPTDAAPNDFYGISSGYVYEYYAPQSLSDTLNAYEALILRAKRDTNYSIADAWADSILSKNKDSVPGLALKASSQLALGDTSNAKQSYDDAIESLQNGSDVLLPDSSAKPLSLPEISYLNWLHVMLNHNREVLGP